MDKAVDNKSKIAGVVLAGGRSSRMEQDKALLDYNGKPLLDHMIGILEQAGVDDVYVSGDFEGYKSIPDSNPHQGPVHAICDVLTALGSYDGVIFVPVDMPLLRPDVLRVLLESAYLPPSQGAHYEDHPLPFCIVRAGSWAAGEVGFADKIEFVDKDGSVRELLLDLGIFAVDLPKEFESRMVNVNTPEEWDGVLQE